MYRHYYFLNCAQDFYTRRGGGIGGPNPPYGTLGSPCKNSHNVFYQINFKDPRVCFLRLLLHSFLYGPYVHERIETGSKILTIQQRKTIDDFTHKSPGISVAWDFSVVLWKIEEIWVMCTRWISANNWLLAKRFNVGREKPRFVCRPYTKFFNHRFK